MNRRAEKAGAWYPADAARLRALLEALLAPARSAAADYDRRVVAGMVPHAGLVYSGGVAAMVYARVAAGPAPETIFVFGATHRGTGHADGLAAVWPDGAWESPVGRLAVDAEAAAALVEAGVARADTRPHLDDNAIELQLPFLAYLFPEARIVPVATPPSPAAVDLGRAAWTAARKSGRRALAIGSSDLTHYGAAFGLMPAGRGPAAVAWTRANSMAFVEALAQGEWHAALAASARDHSACGAGAAVAAGAFAEAAGAGQGELLAHITSAEVMDEAADAEHIVDYAALIFAKRRGEP